MLKTLKKLFGGKKTVRRKKAAKPARTTSKEGAKKRSAKPAISKKTAPKKSAKKSALKKTTAKSASLRKPIGKVTHFYGGIKVAIVKFATEVKRGTRVRFEGATTNFVQALDSMQYDHKEIAKAPKGKQIGIKVRSRVREGDGVHLVLTPPLKRR